MFHSVVQSLRCRLESRLATITLSVSALAPLLLMPAPAMADYGVGAGWVTCSTQSNGYTFRTADYGVEASRARAISDCQRSSYTNNGTCRYNATCEVSDGRLYARCTAESNGYKFYDAGTNVMQAMASAIDQCTKSSYTNNGQCRYSASCEGVDPRSVTRCETRSNGYVFRDADFDGRAAMDRTLQACESSSYTNNGACRASLSCSGGSGGYNPGPVYPGPIVHPAPGPIVRPGPVGPVSPIPGTTVATCTTSSAGHVFSVTGVTFRDTRARVVQVCQSSVRSPAERNACLQNSACR
jgi:hypothetical protein